jgi:hypothetical protein
MDGNDWTCSSYGMKVEAESQAVRLTSLLSTETYGLWRLSMSSVVLDLLRYDKRH